MTARTVAVVQARMGSTRLPGYEALGRDDFTWREALAVVEANPSSSSINREVVQKLVPPANFGH